MNHVCGCWILANATAVESAWGRLARQTIFGAHLKILKTVSKIGRKLFTDIPLLALKILNHLTFGMSTILSPTTIYGGQWTEGL